MPGPRSRSRSVVRSVPRVVPAAAAVVLAAGLAACSDSAAASGVLSAYPMASGTHNYTMRVNADGAVSVPAAMAQAQGGAAQQPIVVKMTADVARKVDESDGSATITSTFSNLNGQVTSGGQTVDLAKAGSAVAGKSFTVKVSPDGTTADAGGQQINIPGARIEGNGCPALPRDAVKPGATWTAKTPLPGFISAELTSQNRYVGISDVGGRKVAQIESVMKGPVDATVDISKLSGMAGGGGPSAQMLAGLQVALKGNVDLASTCSWALSDRLLVDATSKGAIDIGLSVAGGSAPQIAQALNGTSIKQAIDSQLTLRN